MNTKTTITFEGSLGGYTYIDGIAMPGLKGNRTATVVGAPVTPEQMKPGDDSFRREDMEAYLSRVMGLTVTIQMEAAKE